MTHKYSTGVCGDDGSVAAHPFANLESPTQSGADARVHAAVFKPKSSEVTLAMLTKHTILIV